MSTAQNDRKSASSASMTRGTLVQGVAAIESGVIVPTLSAIGIDDPAACWLLSATAAAESALEDPTAGRFGLYQISAADHQSLWDTYLVLDPERASMVRGFASQKRFLQDPHAELVTNMSYATVIAWYLYARHGEPTPRIEDADAMTDYWWRLFRHCRGPKHSFRMIYETFAGSSCQAAA